MLIIILLAGKTENEGKRGFALVLLLLLATYEQLGAVQ